MACPPSEPTGGACPLVGLECEYGSNPNPSCDGIAECTTTGWSSAPTVACPAGTCPATYAAVAQGQSCTPQGLDCSYAEGQCNCTDSIPVAGQKPLWECSTPTTGCPEPRPDIGTACSQKGLSCDYGSCTGGAAEQCTDGYWQRIETPCPG